MLSVSDPSIDAGDEFARNPQQLVKIMHDIGNALGRINFHCEQLHELGNGPLGKSELDVLSAECALCIDLIQQLNADPNTLSAPQERATCDADVVAAQALEGHQNLCSDKIEIEFAATDTESACAISHNSLYRCISNLLINARQAILTRGKISIERSEVNVAFDQTCSSCQQHFSGEFVRLSVADTGIGIFERDSNSIFKPYVTSKQKGSGLGLPIVHELLHQYGGHIQLESHIGRGSCFALYLPKASAKPSFEPSFVCN